MVYFTTHRNSSHFIPTRHTVTHLTSPLTSPPQFSPLFPLLHLASHSVPHQPTLHRPPPLVSRLSTSSRNPPRTSHLAQLLHHTTTTSPHTTALSLCTRPLLLLPIAREANHQYFIITAHISHHAFFNMQHALGTRPPTRRPSTGTRI
jgi:hypothetical protein